MSTISDLLEKTLIDIQNNDGNNDNNNDNDNKPSAVSLLLLERKKQREISKGKHQEEDFIRIAPLSSSSYVSNNTLLNQIASSSLENISENKNSNKNVITNAKQKIRQKGQSYSDKSQSKKATKQSRKERMDKLKRSY